MRFIKLVSISFLSFIMGCMSAQRNSYEYPGSSGDIAEYENFIRYNPSNTMVTEAKQRILDNANRDFPWNQVIPNLEKLDDIDGARYDDVNDRLVIWGPISKEHRHSSMPPLLLDDLYVALTVLEAGQNPGVSIGTMSGRIPTQDDINRFLRTKRLPIEYIPPSIADTHMGSVLFEIDRCLKGLAHGEDNLTLQNISSSVSGYLPVSRRLQMGETMDVGKPRPLGLWWFVPDMAGLAFEGYTVKFVRYRMRVEYRSMVQDPAIADFGNHLNEHFDDFAKELPTFRELVRLHKLVQIARWYVESGFPKDEFIKSYQRLSIETPNTTQMIQTLAGSKKMGDYILQSFLIGGVDLSPKNYYMPTSSLPATNLTPGTVTKWQSSPSPWSSSKPPHYGSFETSTAPLPSYAASIFQSRPSQTSYGWTATVDGRNFAVVSIPMRGLKQPR